jgi:plastocyanin domain-containing protein
MDSTQIAVTIGGIGLIGFTLWFFFGQSQQSGAKKGAAGYSCPMHAWITSNDPGATCSVCGMGLVKGAPTPPSRPPAV